MPYTEAAFTTIQAFFADDKGAVFHAAVASGEELRAREAIVTHGGPGGTFATRAKGVFPKVGWHVEGELVWGATAAVLRNLITVVAEVAR